MVQVLVSEEYIVLDFETTGFFPSRHRVIEVGAFYIVDGHVKDEFNSLCHPGGTKKLSKTITRITGITDQMLVGQPSTEDVIRKLHAFLRPNVPIVAHNSSFDSKFLLAELNRVNLSIQNPFVCSLLLSRRVFPGVSSYKLSHLQVHFRIPVPDDHRAHRALDDARVTVALFKLIIQHCKQESSMDHIPISTLIQLSRLPKNQVLGYLKGGLVDTAQSPDKSSCGSFVERDTPASVYDNNENVPPMSVEGADENVPLVGAKRKSLPSAFSSRRRSRTAG